MRILVTGGNGQLGNELKTLAPGFPFDFTFIDVAELDLLDEQATRRFITEGKYNFIINCAAYTAVDKAEDETELARIVNDLV